ncbi:P-loop containing nucleoside triphosphate hydrolase protein [Trichodelitschia bisporula]|uniref:P-loop containing nucleoside triphosphate hydrolase protein n=1 Tax=Trichodelitschia bisporula TaxID=703511 RepID=A0A6G1I0W5_9PEZI|nr:P-loop containing nucleoside triphosphate hydrolase protein [Trichodelitschia bisporula]
MPVPSSPLQFPATSSPSADTPRKRRKVGERSPLKKSTGNARIGAFLVDSDDEDELPHPIHKKPSTATLTLPSTFKSLGGSLFAATNGSKGTEAHDRLTPVSPNASALPSGLLSFEDIAGGSQNTQPPDVSKDVEPDLPSGPSAMTNAPPSKRPLMIRTCAGKSVYVGTRRTGPKITFEQLVASRSTAVDGKARRSYYGVDIHQLLEENAAEDKVNAAIAAVVEPEPLPTVEEPLPAGKKNRTPMWTEKYRARKFTDLVGDERTHRSVLRWLKTWDPIVFPGSSKPKPKSFKAGFEGNDDHQQKKILLLTGPPGLGKTTLAHVCARQAGYEVQEINASDERSRDVVRGRIRDMVATENVRGIDVKTTDGNVRKAGKPVCVIVDEVDGVVSGSGGGGEGGFIKALLDLVALDQKNSTLGPSASTTSKKKKRDKFRLLRPLILICNDVYHPSLRPLRQSSAAEIVHIRKPPLNMIVSRMHAIFEKEGIPSDTDGVRRLCEATWGVSSKKEGGVGAGANEGDIRSVMVVGEWVAMKLRASMRISTAKSLRLTRRWIEEHLLNDLAPGGGATRSLGHGGARDVMERVFKEGAGFSKALDARSSQPKIHGMEQTNGVIGVAEATKRNAMERLREMIETSGDTDRIMSDCFTSYPTQPIQDDTLLTKPTKAYDWLHFHDILSKNVHTGQEWELFPYLSTPILAFHALFATPATAHHRYAKDEPTDEAPPTSPFTGPGAAFAASEHQKAHAATLSALHAGLSTPLARTYRSPALLATELLPYIMRILAPDVKPVVVQSASAGYKGATAAVRRAAEKALVLRAVNCMVATGLRFEKSRVEQDAQGRGAGWVLRMEPAVDAVGGFDTLKGGGQASEGVRYAVRQVLEMEWRKEGAKKGEESRIARMRGDKGDAGEKEEVAVEKTGKAVRDFFGRLVVEEGASKGTEGRKRPGSSKGEDRIWVSFNEGYSNAVRKPITFEELMRGF